MDQPIALSVQAIRAIERRGRALDLPLMERAGAAAADFIRVRFPAGSQVLALVGPGNNGGDALVTARLLLALGYRVTVVMPEQAHPPDDARLALAQWRMTGNDSRTDVPSGQPDVIIDGLFGIGLSRPLAQPWQSLVEQANQMSVPILALDIPSGVEADSGKALGRPIHATWTLSFISPSLASQSPHAKPWFGECHVASLDIPA